MNATPVQPLRFTDFNHVLPALAQLEAKPPANPETAGWSLPQTLTHCAQSIEYSMQGFPKMRGWLVHKLIGPMVFRRFKKQGFMSHGLEEPIPGAPALDQENSLPVSLARLRKAIADFRNFTAPLHPHFAYGALSKEDTELAHCLHVANHLSRFSKDS